MKKFTDAEIEKWAEDYSFDVGNSIIEESMKPLESRLLKIFTAGVSKGMKLMYKKLVENE